MEKRLIDIEVALANLQKTVDELNDVVVKQANMIDKLSKENNLLIEMIKDNSIKPLSEETPPPHY